MLNAIGSILYFTAALLCARAAVAGLRTAGPRWHVWFWSGAGVFFIGLIAWRLLGVEDLLRDGLRDRLQGQGAYLGRHSLQAPFTAGIIVIFTLAAAALAWVRKRIARRSRIKAIWWAGMGTALMLALIVMRLVSLHAIDAILFGGPHLNWILDPGAAIVVTWAAWRYTRHLPARRSGFRA